MYLAPAWRDLITECKRIQTSSEAAHCPPYSPGVTVWFAFILGHKSAVCPDVVEDFGSPVESTCPGITLGLLQNPSP